MARSSSATSDTETLLWALERWGQPMVTRLSGQFAFAALDLRGRACLLCRDRFGVKPLYLARFDGGVWWASEPAALIAAGAAGGAGRHGLAGPVRRLVPRR